MCGPVVLGKNVIVLVTVFRFENFKYDWVESEEEVGSLVIDLGKVKVFCQDQINKVK